jgi:hypothetical protein
MGNAASAETGDDAKVRRDADARVAAFRLTSRAILRQSPVADPACRSLTPAPPPPPPTLPLAPSPRLRRTHSVG